MHGWHAADAGATWTGATPQAVDERSAPRRRSPYVTLANAGGRGFDQFRRRRPRLGNDVMIVKLLAELGMSRDLGVADVDVTVEHS